MVKTESTLKTTIINSDDGLHNFEIIRTIDGMEGKTAILVTLYPSFSGGNVLKLDSTALHLYNHMEDLGISKVRIINLFSKIVRGTKLSCRGLEVDEKNLDYIEKVMTEKNFSENLFIIGWGSSLSTSVAANTTKDRIIEMYRKYIPKGTLYQIRASNIDKNVEAPHPLWLGINASLQRWQLEEFTPLTPYYKATNTKEEDENREERKRKKK